MDVALIERALKDADRVIKSYMNWDTGDDDQSDAIVAREQITTALIELRKVPTCEPATDEVEAAVNAFYRKGAEAMRERLKQFCEENISVRGVHGARQAPYWRGCLEAITDADLPLPTPKGEKT